MAVRVRMVEVRSNSPAKADVGAWAVLVHSPTWHVAGNQVPLAWRHGAKGCVCLIIWKRLRLLRTSNAQM